MTKKKNAILWGFLTTIVGVLLFYFFTFKSMFRFFGEFNIIVPIIAVILIVFGINLLFYGFLKAVHKHF